MTEMQTAPALFQDLLTRVSNGVSAMSDVDDIAQYFPALQAIGVLLVAGGSPCPLGPGISAVDLRTGESLLIVSRDLTSALTEVGMC